MIRHISSATNTAVLRALGVDLEWVRRHFFHHNKNSYFVIPNLDSADTTNEDEASKALAMKQLAGVLDDLNMVRWSREDEFKALKEYEAKASDTDLTKIHQNRLLETGRDDELAQTYRDRHEFRNHGLYSKAEKMLEITGWSEEARRDIEIFVLEDEEGLTPLLMVLNDSSLDEEPTDQPVRDSIGEHNS